MKARLAMLAARKRAEAEAAATEKEGGPGGGGDSGDGGSGGGAPHKRAPAPPAGGDGSDSEAEEVAARAARKAEKQRRKKEARAAAAAAAAGLPPPKAKKASARAPPARPKRAPAAAAPAAAPAPRADGGGGSDSEAEPAEAPRTAEDDAFIDDEGADPAEGYYSDGAGAGGRQRQGSPTPSSGMEEDGDFDRMFKGGKRKGGSGRRGRADGMTAAEADGAAEFLARLDAAADADALAASEGRPAVHRLRLAGALEAALASARTRNFYLNAGILGTLRAWLEPVRAAAAPGTGPLTLPPARVRMAVLRGLTSLDIDAGDPERKGQLVASGIGRAVLLLSRIPGAAPAEAQAARSLFNTWARPVWEAHRDPEAEAAEAAARAEAALAARAARGAVEAGARAAKAAEEAARGGPLAPGDRGFRRRALPPSAARLDFVRAPEVEAGVAMAAANNMAVGGGGGGGGGAKRERSRVEQKLLALAKKTKAGAPRAAKVSVQGRGLE